MDKEVWNWILGKYPAIEEGTISRETLYRVIEDIYEAGFNDGQDAGYEIGYDSGYADCCDDFNTDV